MRCRISVQPTPRAARRRRRRRTPTNSASRNSSTPLAMPSSSAQAALRDDAEIGPEERHHRADVGGPVFHRSASVGPTSGTSNSQCGRAGQAGAQPVRRCIVRSWLTSSAPLGAASASGSTTTTAVSRDHRRRRRRCARSRRWRRNHSIHRPGGEDQDRRPQQGGQERIQHQRRSRPPRRRAAAPSARVPRSSRSILDGRPRYRVGLLWSSTRTHR